ncbi:MAG: NAD-dependent epimerase/dehydratase family protein [Candidatus Sericytochromatia bacterium]
MRYFLTGATGFIGGRLARQLVEAGHEVVALVRSPEKAGALRELGVTLHPGDIVDKESMRAGMAGCDGVFHVAAWYQVGAGDKAIADQINVEGTRHVLELMRELEIPKGVYTSTLAVFGDTGGRVVDETYRFEGPHLSDYDRTKWEAHYRVALPMIEAGLPLVIVQPGVVYGPGDHSAIKDVFEQYLTRRLPAVPAGTTFAWAHVEDVARAHALAMAQGTPGESYVIAGPIHPLTEALALAERLTGVPAPKLTLPPALLKALAVLVKPVEGFMPDAYTSEGLRVSAGTTYIASNEKAKGALGYAPRSLEEGFKETLEHGMRRLDLSRA